MPRPSPLSDPPAFAAALAAWFARCAKDYPWRRTHDPYAILISEIMLQQTQIPTVLERGYYTRWMTQFPDFSALAAATEDDVMKAWEGLGYYRRAKNLHRLAKVVAGEHGGVMPRSAEAMRSLPGIGPYTAGAVASFAFDEPEALVDGNVTRVLTRLFNDFTPVDSPTGQKKLWAWAEALVAAAASPRVHNSALMELGQTVCRPEPVCASCPVQAFCTAENPQTLPVKGKRVAITEVTERVYYCASSQGVMLEQEKGSRRTGMWKLPALPEAADLPPVLYKSTYGITRYRVTLWVHASRNESDGTSSGVVVSWEDVAKIVMPSPYRRALEAVMKSASFTLK